MTLRYEIVQGSKEWHDLRLLHVGSSECASLFGVQAGWGMSPYTLHMVKAGRIPPPSVVDEPGGRIWFGKRKEAMIAAMAAELWGWNIRPGPYAIDDLCEGMAASLDFVITEPGPAEIEMGFDGPGYLEIKCVDWLEHRRSWTGGEPPHHILLQHQHGLACSGFGWGAIACEIGGNELQRYHYAARPRVVDLLREKVAEFWANVRAGRVPNTDGTESTAAALRELYETIRDELPIDFRDHPGINGACVNFLTTKDNLAESKRRYEDAKNQLEEILAGHTLAECPGFRIAVAVTAAKEERPAPAGYVIPGRKESRRINVTEVPNQ